MSAPRPEGSCHARRTRLAPAEVLVSLYGALGDIRAILVVASALNTVLILASVLLLLLAVAGLRRRRHAVLRTLGAPRSYVMLVVWLGVALITLGCLIGSLFALLPAALSYRQSVVAGLRG